MTQIKFASYKPWLMCCIVANNTPQRSLSSNNWPTNNHAALIPQHPAILYCCRIKPCSKQQPQPSKQNDSTPKNKPPCAMHKPLLISRKLLGRDATPEEAPVILDEFANTASAGSIIAFHRNNADFAAGDIGVICSFGAGYSIGSAVVRRT